MACADASLRDWLAVIALLLAFILFMEARRLMVLVDEAVRKLLERLP